MVILDQAGWHMPAPFPVPDNITAAATAAPLARLNPVDTAWQSLREPWLCHLVRTHTASSPSAATPGAS